MSFGLTAALIWIAWLGSWRLAIRFANRSVKSAPAIEQRPYWLMLVLASALMILAFRPYGDWVLFGHPSDGFRWLMLVLILAGFGFTWWARLHLGVLWSGPVTTKEGHYIVDSGPYGLVRHPIYTGSLFAAYATALIQPGLLSLASVTLYTIAMVMKARLEERFLGAELGEALYADYRKRVPMLVPFWPVRA